MTTIPSEAAGSAKVFEGHKTDRLRRNIRNGLAQRNCIVGFLFKVWKSLFKVAIIL
jgi:hypothetical protein